MEPINTVPRSLFLLKVPVFTVLSLVVAIFRSLFLLKVPDFTVLSLVVAMTKFLAPCFP